MGQSIAVMNTKGGVGKSTVVMGLAETLSVFHQKNVLIIDSDSQTSISIMMMEMARWEKMEQERCTLLDYLSNMVLGPADADWKPHVASNVSDVDDAKTVYLIPSHMKLSLFEREVSAERRHSRLRTAVRDLLDEAKRYFDIILIDCPPGLSVVTECWLRESDFFLPPTKPDYLSVRGLEILKRFKEFSNKHGFASLIGVLINMKDGWIETEDHWHRKLAEDPTNKCFTTPVYRRPYIQKAADFEPESRTFVAKYPGDAGQCFRQLADELLSRMAQVEAAKQSTNRPGPVERPHETGRTAHAKDVAFESDEAAPENAMAADSATNFDGRSATTTDARHEPSSAVVCEATGLDDTTHSLSVERVYAERAAPSASQSKSNEPIDLDETFASTGKEADLEDEQSNRRAANLAIAEEPVILMPRNPARGCSS